MKSKNSARITAAESEHMAAVKGVPCVVCDAPPPSLAHHVNQGDHFTTVAVCELCHVGKGGIHGDQSRWRLRYRIGGLSAELHAINDTLKRVYG